MYAVYETNRQRARDQATRVEGSDCNDLVEEGFETYDEAVKCANEQRGRFVVAMNQPRYRLYIAE